MALVGSLLLPGVPLAAQDNAPAGPSQQDVDAIIDQTIIDIIERNRPAAESLVRGEVVDRESGTPVALADVSFVQGDLRHSVRTDASGQFILAAIRGGEYTMSVQHLAYETATSTVAVSGGGLVTRVRVELASEAVALDAIQVTVDQRPTFGALSTVYDRMDFSRQMGFGRFFERDDIENSGAFRITDMLSTVAGVRVSQNAAVLNPLNPNCGGRSPLIYLDGGRFQIEWEDLTAMVPVSQIEVMEVYRRPSEIPGEFSGSDSECGVIAIWTRRGF